MIKKKIIEDFKSQNIIFEILGTQYQLIRFNQAKMSVDVIELNTQDNTVKNMAYAHIPKAIKKLIN